MRFAIFGFKFTMQQLSWQDKFKRHWPALLGLVILLIGAALPIAGLALPGSKIIEKLAYAIYLCASVCVLWRASRHCEAPSCWAGMDALLLTYSIVPIFQFTLRLPRPQDSAIQFLNGFPSGHAVSLYSLAWLIHLAQPPLGKYWFVAAGFIALSRIVSEYHYAYQVVGGALMGLALGIWLASRPIKKLFAWRLRQKLESVFSRRTAH